MTYTEYGIKFITRKEGNEVYGAIVPSSGDATALCHLLASMHLGGYLPSIDSLLIDPINDLLENVQSELEPFDAEVMTIEFTTDSALLMEGTVLLQTIPLNR